MRKYLLSIGTIATVGASTIAMVSCGSTSNENDIKDIKISIEKIKDFKTTDQVNTSENDFTNKNVGDEVKTMFDKISEIHSSKFGQLGGLKDALDMDFKITSVKLKTKYNDTTKKIVLTVSLQYSKSKKDPKTSASKDITVTFGATDLTKFSNGLNQFSATAAASTNIQNLKLGDDATLELKKLPKIQGTAKNFFRFNAFTNGISIKSIIVKKAYNSTTHKLTATFTLTKTGAIIKEGSESKDIIITFPAPTSK